MGLPQQRERVTVDGIGTIKKTPKTSESIQSSSGGKSFETVEKSGESDITNTNQEKTAESNVHYIGKIDRDKFKSVSDDIQSDEVIITDERIDHIKEHHPEDYENYLEYMKQTVLNPEYIIEANKPNSAVLLKEFEDKGRKFQVVLRLLTSSDNPKFKNSIITFMRIKEKEWKRLLKNKKILYKSE